MAFSDLCHISNAYKSVENEPESERIMEENSMVRDLITKILDETGPSESSIQTPEKGLLSTAQSSYLKNDTTYPSNFTTYPQSYNFPQGEQNQFNFLQNGLQNGFNNAFVNYESENLLGLDAVDSATDVSPEQLNLLRLAAQEIGGAQFTSPANDKFYNFFEPNQRNSLPETNMFPNNTFRPNSLHVDMNFNNYENPYNVRVPNGQNPESNDILSYLNQLNISIDRRDENAAQNSNMDFKMTPETNGHYQEDPKVFFNRNFPPNKNFNGENFYLNEMMAQMGDRPIKNFDFPQTPSQLNFKPNGFHQNEFMQRNNVNQMPRDNFPPNGMNEQRNFENGNMLMRQNQELARQMSLLMRTRPPPNQLNVDVSFLHENTAYNLGMGRSPPAAGVLPSPMLDMPLLAPFYTMRNMRGAATSSGILHARLDACYEQWRQLERERKRTEACLALAYPGRAVSSSNSIPVPRLPPCPTRVDRLTVDMLREHTKVLTLMGKMETLRASVCVAQNKRPNKQEDGKITVLKRGQENVPSEKENGVDPNSFEPATWRDDVKNLSEIAPHAEVEGAMLSWRGAVSAVQAARRRELQPHQHQHRYVRHDPILQLAEAVKQLGVCARRARCAMWCDLTLTVALAPHHNAPQAHTAPSVIKTPVIESSQTPVVQSKQTPDNSNSSSAKQIDSKEDKPTETKDTKPENKMTNKTQEIKNQQQRRTQNYRKLNGRNDFYQKNRYDNRFMQNRHPYYLATGPIN